MRYRWWIAATLLVCCVIAAGFLRLKEPPAHEATLSDGTIVRFENVGIGTIPFDTYPPWKSALAGYVPNRFQSRLGERFKGTLSAQANHIGVLFSIWTADGKRNQNGQFFLSRVEFVESTGFVFKATVSGYNSTANMMCFGEGAFPRRDPILHIRLYERGSERLLFDLHVPNPGYQSSISEWSPEAVPAIQTVPPLTVTLKHGPADFAEKYLSDKDLEVNSTDPRWTDTQPQRHFWLTDATGNRAYDLSGLSPFEPAWKLSVRIRRNTAAEFSADEIWRTEFFTLPAALTAERLELKQIVSGVELGVTMLSSAGNLHDDGKELTVTPTTQAKGRGTSRSGEILNGRAYSTIDSGLPFIQLTHSMLDEETELIVTVRDQTGAKISAENGGWYGMNGKCIRIVQLELTAESTEVQLEVIVNHGRTFEFLVAPPKPLPTMPAEANMVPTTDSSTTGSSLDR